MSEKKLERCSLGEATHIEIGGKLHELGLVACTSNSPVVKCNSFNIEVYTAKHERQYIAVNAFQVLGIKTFREIKPEPIEFEAVFVKHDGQWRQLLTKDDIISIQNCKVAKFKCVQILEDDK